MKTIKNRFYAFLVHLACSLLIASLAVILVFWIWYPGEIAKAAGVAEIFFLVLVVDVCLGPLLTFVVYDPKKRELRRDLGVIALLQISALFYGIYTVGVTRPAYIVFAVDRFELVYTNELVYEGSQQTTRNTYKKVSFWGPTWVAANLPEDLKQRNELLYSSLNGGADLAQFPQYYSPLKASQKEIKRKLRPLETLQQFNLADMEAYEHLIKKYSHDLAGYGYLPLQADKQNLVVVLDVKNGDVMEIIDLKPWG